MYRLRRVIAGKTCMLVAGGKSIELLEEGIEEFKDLDVVWVGINNYTLPEEYILKKIDKTFHIVFDCATLLYKKVYELRIRIPRLKKFFRDKNNIYITGTAVICNLKEYNRNFYEENKDRIIDFFQILNQWEDRPKEVYVYSPKQPGSMSYALGSLICGGAKKIITFGFDGLIMKHNKNITKASSSYYKTELVKEERIVGCGGSFNPGELGWDCSEFNKRWTKIFEGYKKMSNNHDVKILNCSPDSFITSIKNIPYSQIRGEIK